MRECYSQFGEDMVIASFFEKKSWAKHRTKVIEVGSYVDIGSFHPVHLSNTYYFYKLGWRGVNIDATPNVKENFDNQRAEDVNLFALVSDCKEEVLKFYCWGNSVYNTTSKEIADRLISDGRVNSPPEIVISPVITLASVFESYFKDRHCDLLSVDVEGHDFEVIKSNDWARFRPTLVCIECHENSISSIIASNLFAFMTNIHYKLYAWAPPSLIFLNAK